MEVGRISLWCIVFFLVNLTPSANASKAQINVTSKQIGLAADFNRDGVIEFTKKKPFVFWLNDDNDDFLSETSGSDIPGKAPFFGLGLVDHETDYINNSRDLVDYFVVGVKLDSFLNKTSSLQTYTYRLKHADSAVKVLYTSMSLDSARAYLENPDIVNNPESILGDWHNPTTLNGNRLSGFKLTQITDVGSELPKEFVALIKNDVTKGVILVEATKVSDKPLVLEVLDENKTVIDSEELVLNLVEVQNMYRYVNLRGVETGKDVNEIIKNITEPKSFKDADSNKKMMIAMHGYNVSEEDATGWAAETFKRIWQTGSNAMFTFVTWSGNKTQVPFTSFTPNYWTNVVNAFNTSSALAQVVNTLPGSEKSILAHSLANMVVSDAIQNYDMQVTNFFMADAAVALEAYTARSITFGDNNSADRMTMPLWRDYRDPACDDFSCADDKPNNRWLFATEWYALFDNSDARNKLTWRNMFADVFTKTKVKNYYSSTEEVLAKSDGSLSTLDTIFNGDADASFRSWSIQEMGKGTDIAAADLFELSNTGEIDKYGGWGINFFDYNEERVTGYDYNLITKYIDFDTDDIGGNFPLVSGAALQLTTDQIRLAPFFKRFNDTQLNHQVLYGPKTAPLDLATVQPLLPHLLGHAIPALSDAVGSNALPEIRNAGDQIIFDKVGGNINMSVDLRAASEWPDEREPDIFSEGLTRWKHSDIKDVAYLYVRRFYESFVKNEAQLDQ